MRLAFLLPARGQAAADMGNCGPGAGDLQRACKALDGPDLARPGPIWRAGRGLWRRCGRQTGGLTACGGVASGAAAVARFFACLKVSSRQTHRLTFEWERAIGIFCRAGQAALLAATSSKEYGPVMSRWMSRMRSFSLSDGVSSFMLNPLQNGVFARKSRYVPLRSFFVLCENQA